MTSSAEPIEAQQPVVSVDRVVGAWVIGYAAGGKFLAQPIWPEVESGSTWQLETVESNAYFRWQRWKQTDDNWSRIVEFRFDQLGQVVAVAHLQQRNENEHWAPTFGWELTEVFEPDQQPDGAKFVTEISQRWKMQHSFTPGHAFEYLFLLR